MAKRGSPHRHKRRTVLLYGEGQTEKRFLEHLRLLFHGRHAGVAIKVTSGDGGCPDDVFAECESMCHETDFEVRVLFLDGDQTWGAKIQSAASRKRRIYQFVRSMPCIEASFLFWLNGCQQRFDHLESAEVKRRFNREHGISGSMTKLDAERIFPRDVIELAAKQCQVLANLITLIKTGRFANDQRVTTKSINTVGRQET